MMKKILFASCVLWALALSMNGCGSGGGGGSSASNNAAPATTQNSSSSKSTTDDANKNVSSNIPAVPQLPKES